MSFARISLAGTLLQAPEKRFTPNNIAVSVLQVSVPMPPRRNQATPNLVVKVLCWRNLAEAVTALPAGSVVHIEGRLQIASVTTPEGTPKKMFEVDAQQVHQLPGLPTPVQSEFQGNAGTSSYTAPSSTGQAPATYATASTAEYGQSAQAVMPPPPTVQLNELSPDDFLTEDDLPF
jgi:single-stranded DNA-binding protein